MPVPKIAVDGHVRNAVLTKLRAPGVAILVRYGAKLSPPKPDEAVPGIRCTPYKGSDDAVLMEAVGYATDAEAHTAVSRAAQACIDSTLEVFQPDVDDSLYPARIVRRRKA